MKKFKKKLASLICFFIPHKRTRSFVRELIERPDIKRRLSRFFAGWGMRRTEKRRMRDGVQFPYSIAIVAIMKNEGPYL